MHIDLGNALYTTLMIVLAFVSALVLTKTIAKYTQKDEEEEKKD